REGKGNVEGNKEGHNASKDRFSSKENIKGSNETKSGGYILRSKISSLEKFVTSKVEDRGKNIRTTDSNPVVVNEKTILKKNSFSFFQ
ncbi:hypothetical protein NK913_23940, partial [Salmonella enterica subsp. enterica serovar Typhimurium]|uniref:hypothetical protein n=1 Tax=Salmonella enterica TaxID=28901 RepID=UPI0020A4C0DB